MNLYCPSCNGNNIVKIGKIPLMNVFAGKIIDKDLSGGNLYKCKTCNLYFRWPRLSKTKLDKLYIEANPNNWKYESDNRYDWKLAAEWLKTKIGKGSVLDIGCWNGGFLDLIGNSWERYGIEINEEAATRAKEKGVYIIGRDFDRLDQISVQFDSIVAFDIIEHVAKPKVFLEKIVKLVRANGFIIISSGNTEALSWKISGSRYWYCAIPEHISFINKFWCYFVAEELGLSIEYLKMYSHKSKSSSYRKILDFWKNIVYLISPKFFTKLKKIKHVYFSMNYIKKSYYNPPYWATSRDHFIVFFRKT